MSQNNSPMRLSIVNMLNRHVAITPYTLDELPRRMYEEHKPLYTDMLALRVEEKPDGNMYTVYHEKTPMFAYILHTEQEWRMLENNEFSLRMIDLEKKMATKR